MPPQTLTKQYTAPIAIKSLDEQGVFSGYLSVFNNTDHAKEVVSPGAFSLTLAAATKAREAKGSRYLLPVLWQHDSTEPIGGYTEMREDSHGLYVVGQLDLDIEAGKRAYSALKKGYADGLSIGYYVTKDRWKGGTRYLDQLELIEGSIVTVPCNPLANVSAVKAAMRSQPADFMDALAQQEGEDCWEDLDELLDTFQCYVACMGDNGVDTAEGFDTAVKQLATALGQWRDRAVAANAFDTESYMAMMPMMGDQMAAPAADTKAGRALSAANRDRLMAIHQHMSDGLDQLKGMVDGYQAADDGDGKVAPEPETDMHVHLPPGIDIDAVMAAVEKQATRLAAQRPFPASVGIQWHNADAENKASKDPADYAYVPDDTPSHWKLPIHDAEHAKLAAHAVGPNPPHGNAVDIPADDMPKVRSRIRAALRRFDVASDDPAWDAVGGGKSVPLPPDALLPWADLKRLLTSV